MAAYIDQTYYDGNYKGRAVDAAAFPRLALRASEQVDALTFGNIGDIASQPASTQTAVKNATCIIVEGMASLESYSDMGVVSTSESASGAYSYTVDAASVKTAQSDVIARAKVALRSTGLLYAGVGCY